MLTKINEHWYKIGPWSIEQKRIYTRRTVTYGKRWVCFMNTGEEYNLGTDQSFYGEGDTPDDALKDSEEVLAAFRAELASTIQKIDEVLGLRKVEETPHEH